jgi:putative protease
MSDKIELLAPGGDIDSIKVAIVAGADAIYCGLNKFNARNRAENISFENLQGILRLAHQNDCKIFLTLNILICDNEIFDLIRLLNKLVNTSLDGVIIQDLGLFYLLEKYFGSLVVHASTQCTTHNVGQIHFLNKLNVKQINLSRELNLIEIQELNQVCEEYQIKSEIFVHGSYCISFSGQCYISSVLNGNSGNKGRCSQNCRDQFQTTFVGKEFPLNLKDNSAYYSLKDLADSGVASIKIEGRIKKNDYVYSIVKAWRDQVDRYRFGKELSTDNSELHKVFNRDFTDAFLKGNISNDIFIDNPLSNSIKYVEDINKHKTKKNIENEIDRFLEEKEKIKKEAFDKIENLDIEKTRIKVDFLGELNKPLQIVITASDMKYEILSDDNLVCDNNKQSINNQIDKILALINQTGYIVEDINLDNLANDLCLSFKETNRLKKQIFYLLNGNREYQKPVILLKLDRHYRKEAKPCLSVLISSEKDLYLCNDLNAQIYFQLPNSFSDKLDYYFELFTRNRNLFPWFPSILIGEDYSAAVDLLMRLKPQKIVTDNSGIAYGAYKNNILWIAGPYMNLINSYSLLCLKEVFNCSGAFISNEINDIQLKSIKKPEDFELYYSIYHPIKLMTNRLCLFHQVTGCDKKIFDNACVKNCNKLASIVNLNGNKFIIEKSNGNFNCLYNENNYLNTDIVKEIPDTFSSFLIDLRDIETDSKIKVDKLEIVILFKRFLDGEVGAESKIYESILNITNEQYKRGI